MTALLLLLLMAWMPVVAQNPFKQLMHETDPAYFKTDEARQVGDQLSKPILRTSRPMRPVRWVISYCSISV